MISLLSRIMTWILERLARLCRPHGEEEEMNNEIKRLFTVHGGWGHHIEFIDWEDRKVSGHLPDRPSIGDFLEAEMGSGKKAIFRFTDVDYMADPPDMFFATVEDIGYRDELECEELGIPKEEHKSMFV